MPVDITILHVYHKWKSYDVWFLRYGAQQTEFFSFWTIFCPFTLLTTQKIKVLKNWKKMPRDTISHKCTINDNHMMYNTWDMKHNRQNFLSFWAIFSPFTPLKYQKIKILKKRKKQLEIPSFYTSEPKIMIICYTAPEIWCIMDVIVFFHFGLFFAVLPL